MATRDSALVVDADIALDASVHLRDVASASTAADDANGAPSDASDDPNYASFEASTAVAHANPPNQFQSCGGRRGCPYKSVPRMRTGPVEVNGRLTLEVVQRAVRTQESHFMACYESGLKSNPSVQGRVTTKFLIGNDGGVRYVSDGGSDLPDVAVVQCVNRVFAAIKFAKPESGIVTVVYPLIFNPGD